jgi:hypothetical protein
MRPLLYSLLLLMACNNDSVEETGRDALCGDIDGDGGDTGDIPNVLGQWTGQFALTMFDENCTGVDKTDVPYLTGPFEINGYVPTGLRLDFDSDKDRRLRGALSTTGGVTFAGQFDQSEGLLNFAVGGLLYEDASMGGRSVINGAAYVGVDTNKDGQIDCDMRGDWIGFKSGS